MYVVTKDAAMLRAAEKTDTLMPLSSLDDFLQIIVEAQHPDILKKVQSIIDSEAWERVLESLYDEVWLLGAVYTGDLHDAEIIEHSIGDDLIELVDFKVISVADGEIQVVAKVRVPITLHV